MNVLLRSLSILTASLWAAAIGTHFLLAGTAPPVPERAPAPRPAKPLERVRITDERIETKLAVKPKELSPAVKKGLEYLVKSQKDDGGWSQGGGWRLDVKGTGRVEGTSVEDPSDIGNSCLALLALLRAGNTAAEGEYKNSVAKGLTFILSKVEKADANSLLVTDVKGTQLQSKIGAYVDTFLAALVLAEMRGNAGPKEKQLAAALEKTMTKIAAHQMANGGFNGNEGWANVLSIAIANKSIARAKQKGVVLDERVVERALAQSTASATGDLVAMGPGGRGAGAAGFGGGFGGIGGVGGIGGGIGGGIAGGIGDAGVKLYRFGQGAGNSQDIVNSLQLDGEKARQIIKDAKASPKDKDEAKKKLDDLKKAEDANGKVQEQLAANVKDQAFTAGFGSNGGEEFLSFLNISEALLVKGGKDWQEWDAKMVAGLEKAQDKDGSWAGQHCITGKTFCTASALLVLMADRTPFPAEVVAKKAPIPASSTPSNKK